MGFQAVKCRYIEGSKNGPVTVPFGHGPITGLLTFTCVVIGSSRGQILSTTCINILTPVNSYIEHGSIWQLKPYIT